MGALCHHAVIGSLSLNDETHDDDVIMTCRLENNAKLIFICKDVSSEKNMLKKPAEKVY